MHTIFGTTTNCSPTTVTCSTNGLKNTSVGSCSHHPLSYSQTAASLAPVAPTSPHQQQGRPTPATARRSAARHSALRPTAVGTARVSACRAGLHTRTRDPRALCPAHDTPTSDPQTQTPASIATLTRDPNSVSQRAVKTGSSTPGKAGVSAGLHLVTQSPTHFSDVCGLTIPRG